MSPFVRSPTASRLGLVIACSISLTPTGPLLRAEELRQWAVLIGVQEHDNKKFNLRYTENDVKKLRETLIQRAGLFEDRILELTDSGKGGRPTLANLQGKLPDFLAKAAANDRVLVFFSGHGVLFNGATYLVPRDFDARNPAGTGLKLSEVRQMLNDCKAGVKLLILDCCHAGNDKAIEDTLSASAVAKALEVRKKMRNCVVLASCDEDETSKEWDAHQQGVFTYWLCLGLSGAAADERGRVTIDKLQDYVHRKVRESTKDQNPRSISDGRGGTLVVMTLKPETPQTMCRRLAGDLDWEIRRKKLSKIGVLEFYLPQGLSREQLASALLPADCARRLRQELQELAKDSYQVIDAKTMREAVKGIVVEQIRTPAVLEQLGRKAGTLDGIVFGVLRPSKDKINVQCELAATANGDPIAESKGVLPLSVELYAALGFSFDLRGCPAGSLQDENVRRHFEQQCRQGHPLLLAEDKFPFRVELRTVTGGASEPKKTYPVSVADGFGGKRSEWLVGARDGERFEIYVQNKSPQRVGVRLLADGTNTLEEKPASIGAGRMWVFNAGQGYAVRGWVYPERKRPNGESEFYPFLFRDAARLEAGRKKFGESIGLITAAFYAEAGRDLVVDKVPVVETQKLKTVEFRVGQLLAVVNIRYVDERDLPKK